MRPQLIKNLLVILFLQLVLVSTQLIYLETPSLTEEQAHKLLQLPIKCLVQEYPNKLGQVLDSPQDLKTPRELHPSFYGCFDWHSSVHGHWTIVRILNIFPNIKDSKLAITLIKNSLTKENIQKEVMYFNKSNESGFERAYGWAWIFKLTEELKFSKNPELINLLENLFPLTNTLIDKFEEFLSKLVYPVRVGMHENSAFALGFALDYAKSFGLDKLSNNLKNYANRLYYKDEKANFSFEPAGYDFLSPILIEIDLMKRVLDADVSQFNFWLSKFMPELFNKEFDLEVAKVTDRKDGKLVHLDGLNFSRAWVLYNLGKIQEFQHLIEIGDKHVNYSLPSIIDGEYMGEHWLGSFALYALCSRINFIS